jgi:hypothetical protein
VVSNSGTPTLSANTTAPVDLIYRKPDGWTSRPEHCGSRTEAERLRDATNLIAPAAAARRTWSIEPCTCGGAR